MMSATTLFLAREPRLAIGSHGARQLRACEEGRAVAFRTDLSGQDFGRGDRGEVARFVEDWRTLSAGQAKAGEPASHALERMIDRMQGDPALDRAVDRVDPERHLHVGDIGRSKDMDRGFDMGM